MKPLRLPSDAARAIKDYYAAVLPGLIDPPVPTIEIGVPVEWTVGQSGPHLGVFDDSGPALWPIYSEPTVRVTVWANGRTLSRKIAGIALGVLYAHRIPGVAKVDAISSLLEARDPNNAGVMASFTASVKARTLPIS